MRKRGGVRRGSAVLASCLVVGLSGCTLPQEPNPFDVGMVAPEKQPDMLLKNIKLASDFVNDRVGTGDITPDRGRELLTIEAKRLADQVNATSVPASKAWELGEAYITAKEWDRAAKILKVAAANAVDDDRRVNDTLRLAHAEAELGQLDQAIATTREAFKAPPNWKWPILYATYLEIVPAAVQKDPAKDVELAKLVEDAVSQHELATGSPDDPSRRDWLSARTYHIRAALAYASQLYTNAGRSDLAAKVAKRLAALPT